MADPAQTLGERDSPLRLLLVDAHEIVRAGLRLLLESHRDWTVVGETGSADDAVALAREIRPDVVVLDLKLGGESGIDLISRLVEAAPGARILVLTAVRTRDVHESAVAAGATGIVVKDRASSFLFEAIAAVAAGDLWLDRPLVARALERLTRRAHERAHSGETAKVSSLTKRERELIPLICEGLRNREIAGRLHISEATTRHHLTSIFAKLGVSGRLGLIVYAVRQKLIPPGYFE